MDKELLFQIALTQVPNIGPVHAKNLLEHFGSATNIFQAPLSKLEKLDGIGTLRAKNIKQYKDFNFAEKEIVFINKYKISPLFLNSNNYPINLKNCYDPPTLLYFKGSITLNDYFFIGIVGTRSATEYGKNITRSIVRELAGENVVIVSGLANGIDAEAHKAALEFNIPTIGVLAHGLDTIYPVNHHQLAMKMINAGGLLSEFPSKTMAEKHHFPSRNRIVAGLCDALIVIETGIKGGSMITAELSHQYNREVFAVPGRVTDKHSKGCNHLVWQNKAVLFTNIENLLTEMGWKKTNKTTRIQPELFMQLSIEEQAVFEIIKELQPVHIDIIKQKCNLTNSGLSAALLQLEIKSLLNVQPGNLYSLL